MTKTAAAAAINYKPNPLFRLSFKLILFHIKGKIFSQFHNVWQINIIKNQKIMNSNKLPVSAHWEESD